jgi:prepilin-type processing-associated H-X9-DG protein
MSLRYRKNDFNENAFHSETSNLSFVDGRVEKKVQQNLNFQ